MGKIKILGCENLDDRNFNEFIATEESVVIATAGYCKPCIHAIETATKEGIFLQSNIGIVELTDIRARSTMRKLHINKVPTVIYYRNGKELKRAVGSAAVLDITDQACKSIKDTVS